MDTRNAQRVAWLCLVAPWQAVVALGLLIFGLDSARLAGKTIGGATRREISLVTYLANRLTCRVAVAVE